MTENELRKWNLSTALKMDLISWEQYFTVCLEIFEAEKYESYQLKDIYE